MRGEEEEEAGDATLTPKFLLSKLLIWKYLIPCRVLIIVGKDDPQSAWHLSWLEPYKFTLEQDRSSRYRRCNGGGVAVSQKEVLRRRKRSRKEQILPLQTTIIFLSLTFLLFRLLVVYPFPIPMDSSLLLNRYCIAKRHQRAILLKSTITPLVQRMCIFWLNEINFHHHWTVDTFPARGTRLSSE